MSVHCIAFTDRGEALANRICEIYPGDVLRSHGNEARKRWTEDNFRTGNVLIFVGAMGIAVRTIAPYVADKTTDPAVIVVDEAARHVIPVLSGVYVLIKTEENPTAVPTSSILSGFFMCRRTRSSSLESFRITGT